jgi:hypothetical protein
MPVVIEDSETKHASSNRAASEAAAAPRDAGGPGLSPARSNVVYCKRAAQPCARGEEKHPCERSTCAARGGGTRRVVCEAQRAHV